jgi:diacylglycerol kinase family enzyme
MALAKELAPSGIQVNAVACGAIDTEMNSHLSDDDKAELAEEIPAGRFGDPQEVAELVKSLSGMNSYLTIVIVGGDGALNDALNGIMYSDVEDKSQIALGIIPNGIGNDFAKYWGLSSDDYKKAVDVLINRRLRKIDIGVFSYFDGEQHQTRYFLNAVYMGLGARIVRITNETRRFWGIPLISYLASLFLVAFERKFHYCKSAEKSPNIWSNKTLILLFSLG